MGTHSTPNQYQNKTPLTVEQQQLAEKWMFLARRISKTYAESWPWVDPDEIQSAAMMCLVRAARSFIPKSHGSFGSYAGTSIARGILGYCRGELVRRGRAKGECESDQGDFLGLDQIGHPQSVDTNLLRLEEIEAFEAWLAPLNGKQRRIFRAMFLNGKTQTEVSKKLGVSRQRVEFIVRQAMDEIRTAYPDQRKTA